jgi:hypothetical protein
LIAGDSITTIIASTVHWIIKPLPRMRLAVFFRLRLRLSLQNTAALPTPILSLNLVQRPGGSQCRPQRVGNTPIPSATSMANEILNFIVYFIKRMGEGEREIYYWSTLR